MDLLKKVELLLSAKARSVLPHRERQGALAEEEAALLAEIRQALGAVTAKEQELAQRIKIERTEAQAAAEQGDVDNHLAHERRATELEHHLRQESTLAINLEEKLAALEEKLALAQEAVDQEAQKTARRDAEASRTLERGQAVADERMNAILDAPTGSSSARSEPDLETRKSRLSD